MKSSRADELEDIKFLQSGNLRRLTEVVESMNSEVVRMRLEIRDLRSKVQAKGAA